MLFEQTATIDYYFVCNWRGDVIRIYDGAGKEIDHKVVINGKPYFLAHAYTVGRDFTFTHGWYIVDRETGDLYKAYAAADLYYYVEKD